MSIAFHNDPALAEMVRGQVAAHVAADEIVQGAYWENGKGCFIGCIAHSDSADTVEELTGFPIMLTRIAESIFEGLPAVKAKDFLPRAINCLDCRSSPRMPLIQKYAILLVGGDRLKPNRLYSNPM